MSRSSTSTFFAGRLSKNGKVGRLFQASDVTVAIPTYGREQVLLDTIRGCLQQTSPPGEVLVVDQTPQHGPETKATLQAWCDQGRIRVLPRERPSQPAAINYALLEAAKPLVLFLDDDVVLAHDLVEQHALAHHSSEIWAVVGQILQPGEQPVDYLPSPLDGRLKCHLGFRFNSSRRCWIQNCMSGNLSVRRQQVLAIGGVDENFELTVAYRFDTDFARRVWNAGGRILFEPRASIRHLRASSGGTRTFIDHRRSHRPDHSVGDYYFALRHGGPWERWAYSGRRLVRSVLTKYHLRRPWWIVPKLIGELRGLGMAMRLAWRGPKLIAGETSHTRDQS